jgi:hypothetical protein
MEMEHRRVSRVKIKPLRAAGVTASPAILGASEAAPANALPQAAEQKNMFETSAKADADPSAEKKVAAKARRAK